MNPNRKGGQISSVISSLAFQGGLIVLSEEKCPWKINFDPKKGPFINDGRLREFGTVDLSQMPTREIQNTQVDFIYGWSLRG